MKLISQIESNKAKGVSLFFEESRVAEEVKNNLVSVSAAGVVVNENEKSALTDALLGTIDNIEVDLKLRYPDKHMKLYLWFDEGETVLRWTVISDIAQKNLPFSSSIEEVTIDKVIENWLAPQRVHNDDELSFSEIEDMSASELRELTNSLEVPSLDVFIRSFPSKS